MYRSSLKTGTMTLMKGRLSKSLSVIAAAMVPSHEDVGNRWRWVHW